MIDTVESTSARPAQLLRCQLPPSFTIGLLPARDGRVPQRGDCHPSAGERAAFGRSEPDGATPKRRSGLFEGRSDTRFPRWPQASAGIRVRYAPGCANHPLGRPAALPSRLGGLLQQLRPGCRDGRGGREAGLRARGARRGAPGGGREAVSAGAGARSREQVRLLQPRSHRSDAGSNRRRGPELHRCPHHRSRLRAGAIQSRDHPRRRARRTRRSTSTAGFW